MTDESGKLAQALAKAQGEMKPAFKDKINPFFKSSYSDLESIWSVCREPLSKNGLSISHLFETLPDGSVLMHTKLLHSSGEYLNSILPIRPVKNDPQGIMSAITYMKRCALMAIVGVSTSDDASDDDGERAMNRSKDESFSKNSPSSLPIPKPVAWKIGPDDFEILKQAMEKAGWAKIDLVDYVKSIGLASFDQMNKNQFDTLCGMLKKYESETR